MSARILARSALLAVLLSACAPNLTAQPLTPPEDFVSLRPQDSGVILDIRYATERNFIGRRVHGYKGPACWLTRPAADALMKVQKSLQSHGMSLKIFDCYRPTKAVADFLAWAKEPLDQSTKAEYYPNLDKQQLVRDEYIASKSGHSRGSTVDVTLVKVTKEGTGLKFTDVDMGTPFDYFDTLAHTENPAVGAEILRNRNLLKTVMEEHGFQNFSKEWWHYRLANEPYPETYFDFDVTGPASSDFHVDVFDPPLASTYESREIVFPSPMDRAVLSWNLTPSSRAVRFEVTAKDASGNWLAWVPVAQWTGKGMATYGTKVYPGAKVDVDTIELAAPSATWKYRAVIEGTSEARIHAMALATMNSKTYGREADSKGTLMGPLKVPPISQLQDGVSERIPDLASKICSPTSVAMLLQYLGIEIPALPEFVQRTYDHGEKIYGTWPINTAAIFSELTHHKSDEAWISYVRWYESLDELLARLHKGVPVIVSIRYKEGELDGAPKPTAGHLLLVRGGDRNFVYVNDPAAPSRETVARKYRRDQFVRAWKGIAYVTERLENR